ncbi:MAG: GatB/YqeY domain-containing protein [Calditrichia bacterium]
MSLEAKLTADMKDAMKSGDKARLTIVRILRSKIKDAQIEKGEALTDEDVLVLLKRAAKQGRDSIQQFRDGGREERAVEEEAELAIIESYLPEQLGKDEIVKVVVEVVESLGAASMQDMGKVMGAAMAKLKGQADGKLVQQVVRDTLTAL